MIASPSKRESKVKRLSLKQNFSWSFVGNMIYAASQGGILVALAKLGSPEIVGQFALGLAVTAPIILFANCQLRSIQTTDTQQEYSFGDYLGLRLCATLIAYLSIVVIVVASGYRQDTALVILLIGLAKSFEAVSDITFGLLQQRERMDRIAKSLIIEGPITLIVMVAILYVSHSLVWATVGMAVVWGLQLVFYDFQSVHLIFREQFPGVAPRPRFHWKTLQKLAWLSLPLGLATMMMSLNFNIPRYAVERYWGEKTLGIFAAIAYLTQAGSIVVSALGQSASPRLAQHFATHNLHAFRRLMIKLIGIGLALGIIGAGVVAIAGQPILTILYKPEYSQYATDALWITIAGAVSYLTSFISYGTVSIRYFKIQPIMFGVSIIINIVLCQLLIPQYGIKGAAWAMILTYGVQFVFALLILVYANRQIMSMKIHEIT